MSAGSFRGDAADSKNNGARNLLRRRAAPWRGSSTLAAFVQESRCDCSSLESVLRLDRVNISRLSSFNGRLREANAAIVS